MAFLTVVKVGGSLYDLPDLGARLTSFLVSLAPSPILLVPGGGALTDTVRELDKTHDLGEDVSHWLALRSLTINAHFLASLLSDYEVVSETLMPHAILDPFTFARADESRAGRLPHRWSVTSDSMALRAAIVFGARTLILLKSVDWPDEDSWQAAAEKGIVDFHFPKVLQGSKQIEIRVINFRYNKEQ